MTIRPLSSLGASALPQGSALRICVVSLIGAVGNGGIGTATDAIVRHFARDGHAVTLLYTLVEKGRPVNVAMSGSTADHLRGWQDWRADLAADGVTLEMLDHQGSHNDWLAKSWCVKEFIARHDFDVVCFDEWQGTGYYSLLAKRAGLAPFAAQRHVVFTHASKQWVCKTNDEYLRQLSDVTVLGMERRSVEMADMVISPSRYLLEEYGRFGWSLPPDSFHHPLPLLTKAVTVDGQRKPVDELVFFGRLEPRKGLWLFCDALDRLGHEMAGKTVTFMGPLTVSHGNSIGLELLQRSANWRFPVRLVTDLGSRQAQDYMAGGNRLAVMPSLDDNSPCVIYECMQAGIPFVTTSSGGGKELIDPAFWPDTVVEPSVDALAGRLAALLRHGARASAPSFAPVQALAVWTGWLRLLAKDPSAFRRTEKATGFILPRRPPLLVLIDSGTCPVVTLLGNIARMVRRFGSRARVLVLSDRRAAALHTVQEMLSNLVGPEVACFGPDGHSTAHQTIAAAEIAFFMDADTELLTPFFLMALAQLARPEPVLVTCIGAARGAPEDDLRIEVLSAGDIPGLAALGQIVTGPVWAIAPSRAGWDLSDLVLRDDRHDTVFNAWTLGEAMARVVGASRLHLLPMVGAVTTDRGDLKPLQTVERLRIGARRLGLGSSLHSGGVARFALETFRATVAQPAGALTLRSHPLGKTDPLAQSIAAAEAEGDLAVMAALCARPDLALQIEAETPKGTGRVEHLIALAVQAERRRPPVELVPALAGAVALSEHSAADDLFASGATVLRDPRLTITDGRLLSSGTTRKGGPAKIWLPDLQMAGHRVLDLRLRSNSPQPLLLQLRIIDQDCGTQMSDTALRIGARAEIGASIPLPAIHARITLVLELSGAEHIDLSLDRMALL